MREKVYQDGTRGDVRVVDVGGRAPGTRAVSSMEMPGMR